MFYYDLTDSIDTFIDTFYGTETFSRNSRLGQLLRFESSVFFAESDHNGETCVRGRQLPQFQSLSTVEVPHRQCLRAIF
jgi:hypothetical protein